MSCYRFPRSAYSFFATAAMLMAVPSLSGCVPVVAGGVAATGVGVAQERSIGSAIDDTTISTAIRSNFTQNNFNELLVGIGVEVLEGRVLLTGKTSSQPVADEAVRLAWQVKGVKEVINEIQVGQGYGAQKLAQDGWITTQIRSRMALEKNLRSINYKVETVNGVVYVLGIAQNAQEMNKALHIARTTKYVQRVVSHVILRGDPRRGESVAP